MPKSMFVLRVANRADGGKGRNKTLSYMPFCEALSHVNVLPIEKTIFSFNARGKSKQIFG